MLRYIDVHLEWAPLLRAAHAECNEKLNGADLRDLSDDDWRAAIKLLSRITERNRCDLASDRKLALADAIELLVDAIVAAEASTLDGLRAEALAALWEARPSSSYVGSISPMTGVRRGRCSIRWRRSPGSRPWCATSRLASPRTLLGARRYSGTGAAAS